MSDYWIPPASGAPTLLIGYAQVTEPAIRTGIRELAEVISTAG